MKRHLIAWLTSYLLISILHIQCTESTVGNGGSSETVNAKVAVTDTLLSVITVEQVDEELSVRIFTSSYRPYEKTGFTDSTAGSAAEAVSWSAPAPGSYNLLLTLQSSGRSCFVNGITLEQGAADTLSCILGNTLTLAGTLATTDSSAIDEPYVLAIYGSPFYSLTDANNRFAVGAVPPGKYTIRVRPTAKRLFITTSDYSIVTDALGPTSRLRVIVP